MDERNPAVLRWEVLTAVRRLSIELEDLTAVFADVHSLHRTAARALVALMDARERGQSTSAGSLGETLGLSSAAVTALVDRMVEAGHVRRAPDPTDRRRVVLVTESAADLIGEGFYRPLAEELDSRMLDLDADDLQVVLRFLRTSADGVADYRSRVKRLEHGESPGPT